MNKEYKEYLDSLPNDFLIAYLWAHYGTREPVWEKCSKKEYETNCGNPGSDKLTTEHLLRFEKKLGIMYRAVPIYNNGGGILDQISGKKPDGYKYEKSTYYKSILVLGNEMIEYCKTRECMKEYIKIDSIMKRIYISGPISGHNIEERRKAFKEIQSQLEAQGYEPVNPMENGLPDEATTHEHMKRDIELLMTCDYIYMMRRWTHSKGCKVEFDIATAIGLPVFFEESGELIEFE